MPTDAKPQTTLPSSRLSALSAVKKMRACLADPTLAGERATAHLDLARPRRGVWIETWSKLPGLMRDCASGAYTHALLPGWQYTAAEMRTEMIEDLERYALTGEQPKVATR